VTRGESDVIVVGSGAAGLTAAILARDGGARVTVLERSGLIGGTTAVSGGAAWIPVNRHTSNDTREEAIAYCKRVAAGQAPDELIETFVDTGHEMVRYLEEHTPLKLTVWSMPDYHPHLEGAKMSGRSLEPELFDKHALGAWAGRLRQAPLFLFPATLQEATFTYQATLKPWNLPADLLIDRLERGIVAGGNALIGALLKGCLDRGIAIETDVRARRLVMHDDCVAGLRAERDRRTVEYTARAVVLASGGFEWNEALRTQYLTGAVDHPNSPPETEGDGLLMALEAGAAVANMSEVWGSPSVAVPDEEYDGRPLSRLAVAERSCPHSILVNASGGRFVNEGLSYNELNKAFDSNLPCWAIFDRQYRERYPLMTVMPGDPDPEWLLRDGTIAGLAAKAGIDAAGLSETIERWNGYVAEGADPDFGRQRSPIDFEAPHPSMGTIERPPFYALPVYQGTLGTKGGPVTNKHGQVLDREGNVINGLYAAGNLMASVAGAGYFGGGATIGLALTWGYICGRHAAGMAAQA
jgi:succinate dehydrogenase/fumarate reductase flavoprotein subunit